MPRVLIDTIQDSGLQWGPDGISLVRSMVVDELSGDPSDKLFEAIFAPGVPQPNTNHPNPTLASYGVMVVGYDMKPTNPPSNRAVVALVKYHSPWRTFGVNLLVKGEAGLMQEITDMDMSKASVYTIDVLDGGAGYSSAPTVAVTGGGGSGATATAAAAGGKVTSVSVTAGGTGFTSQPTIGFTGGGGAGASARANLGGRPIQVLYFPSVESGSAIPDPIPAVEKSGGQVPVLRPYKKIVAMQNVLAATLNGFNDGVNVDPFLGYTNADWYRGKPPQTWLVMSAVWDTQNGRNYILTREVMWKPNGWLQDVAYVLPSGTRPYNTFIDRNETGLDPGNPTTYATKKTNGFARVKVYGTTDFSALGF